VPALEAAGASFVSLANNHVLDYREPALRDTESHLTEAGIANAGAGTNRESALEPTVFEAGDLTVAAFGLTDQSEEFAAAESEPGTAFATLDPSVSATRSLVEEILDSAAAHDPDLVVASLHWGPNWETEPRAVHEAFGRWLVDQGVDVVHGHSAHVLQGSRCTAGDRLFMTRGLRRRLRRLHRPRGRPQQAKRPLRTRRAGRRPRRAGRRADRDRRRGGDAGGRRYRRVGARDTLTDRSAAFGTEVEQSDEHLAFPLGGTDPSVTT